MSKKVVCVIFGGASSEHEVSRVSAANVLNNIDKDLFEVKAVGITKEGSWYLTEAETEEIKSGKWENANNKRCIISPDTKHHGLLVFNKNGDVSVTKIDVIFPVLHGKNGEDGTIQGLFELAKIPYVGNGVLASSVCMDKSVTKKLLALDGIEVTEGFTVYDYTEKDFDRILDKTEKELSLPVVVKPSNAGSSVGVSLAETEEELKKALDVAQKEDRVILIERAVDARELECAVFGAYDDVCSAAPGEIIKATKMYDYETKYIDDTSSTQIPAVLTEEQKEKLMTSACKAFKALGCFGLARVDFFIDKKDGRILLNEINTLPGFTDISLYPKAWENEGISYKELITKVIEIAFKRV